MAPAAAAFYGDPTSRLKRGNHGHQREAFLIRALLEANGTQTGLLGQ
jgi:hypothetical protein